MKKPGVKIYPVGLGNHENAYWMVRIKGVLKMKALIDFETESAYIIYCKFEHPNFAFFADKTAIIQMVNEAFDKKDIQLITNGTEFDYRSYTESKKYKDLLLKNVLCKG